MAYGQVYVRGTEDDAAARAVTTPPARHSDVAWSPDGGTLYFVGEESGRSQVHAATVALSRSDVQKSVKDATTRPAMQERYAPAPDKWADALAFHVEAVTQGVDSYSDPVPSPEGRRLALHKNVGDLVVLDLVTGDETIVFNGWDSGLSYLWSPDGRHLLFNVEDADFNADLWIKAADGTGEAINLTRHPDNDYNPSLSSDGRVLTFTSERVDEEYDVWQVYLDEETEALPPAEMAAYYKELADATKAMKPIAVPGFATRRGTVSPLVDDEVAEPAEKFDSEALQEGLAEVREAAMAAWQELSDRAAMTSLDELALDTAYLRLRRLSREPGSETNLLMLPDASAVLYQSGSNLMRKPWDGSASEIGAAGRLLNTTTGGSTVAMLTDGRAATMTAAGGGRETWPASDTLRIDVADEQEQKFRELATTLGAMFYHPTMKGLDWPTLVDDYAQLARLARTGDEFEHVGGKLLGELNASHLGRLHASGQQSDTAPFRQARRTHRS